MITGGHETLSIPFVWLTCQQWLREFKCAAILHSSSPWILSSSQLLSPKHLSFTFENVVGFDCLTTTNPSPNSTNRQPGHGRFIAQHSAHRPPATEGTPPSRNKTRDTFPVPASLNLVDILDKVFAVCNVGNKVSETQQQFCKSRNWGSELQIGSRRREAKFAAGRFVCCF
jgi:hypothetical protein